MFKYSQCKIRKQMSTNENQNIFVALKCTEYLANEYVCQ